MMAARTWIELTRGSVHLRASRCAGLHGGALHWWRALLRLAVMGFGGWVFRWVSILQLW